MAQLSQATLFRLNFLRNILKQLLEENGQNTDMNQPKLKLAWQIKHEIEIMGFPVDCKLGDEITVTISRPKDNLTPEEQKIYDDWYSDVIGIKNPNTDISLRPVVAGLRRIKEVIGKWIETQKKKLMV